MLSFCLIVKGAFFMTKKQHNYLVILIFSGMLAAIAIVLTRVGSIPIGNTIRIGFGELPVFLSGLWFGPLVGLAVGAVSDTVGALIFTGWNPWLTIPMALTGALTAVVAKALKLEAGSEKHGVRCALKIVGVIFPVHIFCSGILMTVLLNYFYPTGKALWVFMASRIGIALAEAAVQCVIIYVLFMNKNINNLVDRYKR